MLLILFVDQALINVVSFSVSTKTPNFWGFTNGAELRLIASPVQLVIASIAQAAMSVSSAAAPLGRIKPGLESAKLRSLFIRVRPAPSNLAERRAVLRALQRYADIEVFKKLAVSRLLVAKQWPMQEVEACGRISDFYYCRRTPRSSRSYRHSRQLRA